MPLSIVNICLIIALVLFVALIPLVGPKLKFSTSMAKTRRRPISQKSSRNP